MNMPILATKLYIPLSRTKVVPRPHLIERLNEGLDRKLTLISASAGFGKTTLVSEWVVGCNRPAAWLSLDDGDNDLLRFLTHLVAALQMIAENTGRGVVSALKSPQPMLTESTLTILINDISKLSNKCVLVLDDYHVIDAKPVNDAVNFLLEHLPSQMHLVIATRENPQLPLGRLRSRGHLTEMRAADLRFTSGETGMFLNQIMGFNLTEDEMTALDTRTEGWIAGLQLAALSMHGRQDIPAFIRTFAGDNRYIVDYLVEEVLQRQPDHVRSFLLQTSILDRLHGSLCDAVTGQEEGNAQLETLERGNFFVVPLDDRRSWYRYHHLFAAVLTAHLRSDQPDYVAELHRRASKWYEQHGMAADAIRHALAAGDFERAANLVELAMPALSRNRQESAVLGWLKLIPSKLIYRRPVLSVGYAWALLACGQSETVENLLRSAERWLELKTDTDQQSEAASTEMVVVDEAEYRILPSMIALYRAAHAQALGDISASMDYARQVLELVPEDDHLRRGSAVALLGLAYWASGDLESAYRMFADGMANVQVAGGLTDAIGGSVALSDIRIAQGRLRQAMHVYERGLQLAIEQGEPEMRGTADMHVGMSELYREQDDLHAAVKHLMISKAQGEHTGFPQHRYRWLVAMARIREAQGDLEYALDLYREAERVYVSDFFPNVRPVAALKARLWIVQERLGEAFDWAREHRLSTRDNLCYLREFEHITLARLLIAQYKRDRSAGQLGEAMDLLERLLQAAEEGARQGSMIEILVLQAMAHHLQGDTAAALVPLERVLIMAESEGYVRIFVDEGRPMAALLEEAEKQGIALNVVRRLLKALVKTDGRPTAKQMVRLPLNEPLSERERDVLRLLGTELSGPDIARELNVSLNTLRTHTKHIYGKLEVNNRLAAVRRGKDLGFDLT